MANIHDLRATNIVYSGAPPDVTQRQALVATLERWRRHGQLPVFFEVRVDRTNRTLTLQLAQAADRMETRVNLLLLQHLIDLFLCAQHDVVLTAYSTVNAHHRPEQALLEISLRNVTWPA